MYTNRKYRIYAKLFYILTILGLIGYVILGFYTIKNAMSITSQVKTYQETAVYNISNLHESVFDIKYILIWTFNNEDIFDMEEGQKVFLENNCSYTNCFISTDKKLLFDDYIYYDAIIFNVSIMRKWKLKKLPQRRSSHQKYIFYGMESSVDNVICDIHADQYFNWTWSYKLYSDIFTPFIEILDKDSKRVAPDPNVVWNDFSDINSEENGSAILKSKSVAWVINKCEGNVNRMMFVNQLNDALKDELLNIDVYGCGNIDCPNKTDGGCDKMIRLYYYCYLAYEDNISNDYVSKEVLKAYNNDALPIVMGGSDYTKFLPPGSYINARHTELDTIAAIINYAIRNTEIYKKYFLWKKYYTVREYDQLKGFCLLCEKLNNPKFMAYSSYKAFRHWWYQGSLQEKCYPKGAETYNDLLSYMREANYTTNATFMVSESSSEE